MAFFDESGSSLIPPVRRTWSVRGHTPILRHRMAWQRESMAAAFGYRPDGTKARLCFHLQPDSYDTDSLIGVLEQLAGFYTGHRVVLIWDGLSAHWSHKLRAHLDAEREWLTVERLPAYAPELNPVQGLWANLNGAELANFGGDTVAEVADQTQHGIQRVCDSNSLVVGSSPTPGCPSTRSRHPKVKGSNKGNDPQLRHNLSPTQLPGLNELLQELTERATGFSATAWLDSRCRPGAADPTDSGDALRRRPPRQRHRPASRTWSAPWCYSTRRSGVRMLPPMARP
jgi:hypothetical protein